MIGLWAGGLATWLTPTKPGHDAMLPLGSPGPFLAWAIWCWLRQLLVKAGWLMARVREIPGARLQIFNEIGEGWSDTAGPQLVARSRGFAGYWTGLLRRRMSYGNHYKGGRFYSVRFGSDVEYAEVHEKGRGPVYPVSAKVLRWFDKMTGKPIFRMKAGPAAGRFYLYKALKALGLRGARRIG